MYVDEKLADKVVNRLAEAQRKAAQHNLSLSEESLEEYRRLSVVLSYS